MDRFEPCLALIEPLRKDSVACPHCPLQQGINAILAASDWKGLIKYPVSLPYILQADKINYHTEKPVSRVVVTDIRYELNKAKYDKKPPQNLNVLTVINRSHIPQNIAKSIEYTTSTSKAWSFGNGIALGTSMTLFEKEIDSGAGEMSLNVQSDAEVETHETNGEATTKETTDSIEVGMEISWTSKMSVTIVAEKFTSNVPFIATMKKYYFDGTTDTTTSEGIFRGVHMSNVHVQYSVNKQLEAEEVTSEADDIIIEDAVDESSEICHDPNFVKSETFSSYPTEKRLHVSAYHFNSADQIDNDLVNRMFDGNLYTRFDGRKVQYGERPEGVTFDFGHRLVFKRLALRYPDELEIGKICLSFDDEITRMKKPDAIGCLPTRTIERTTNRVVSQLTWEDYQMNLVGKTFTALSLEFRDKGAWVMVPEVEIFFTKTSYSKSNMIPSKTLTLVKNKEFKMCSDWNLMNAIKLVDSRVDTAWIRCAPWNDKVTTLPKEMLIHKELTASHNAGANLLCPWSYFVTRICNKNCYNGIYSLTCTKFKGVNVEGQNSQIELSVAKDKLVSCPRNYAMVGFCRAGENRWGTYNTCMGHYGSITCAPIAFHECPNARDVLQKPEVEYRLTHALNKAFTENIKNEDEEFEVSFWKTENYQEDVCALGDVMSRGLNYTTAHRNILVRSFSTDALLTPTSTVKVAEYKDYEIHELTTEDGYVCLGHIVKEKNSEVDLTKYCCVREDLTVLAREHKVDKFSFSVRDHHDVQGLVSANFYRDYENYRVSENLNARLLRVDNYNVQSTFDMRGPKDRKIQVQETSSTKIWTLQMDSAAKKRHRKNTGFTVWRAAIQGSGYHRVGDILSDKEPHFHFIIKSKDRRAIMPPLTFFEAWTNDNQFLKKENVTVWEPSCPSNYQFIGNVITINDENNKSVMPAKSDCSCVHSEHIAESAGTGQIMKTFSRKSAGKNLIDYHQSTFIKTSSVQYIAEKPVASSRMIEVKYDMESKEINPDNIKGLRKASVINRSYFPQCATRSYEFTVGVSSSFSVSTEIAFGISLDVGQPPGIPDSLSLSWSEEESEEKSRETANSVGATLEMPEESQLSVTILRREYEQKIPFRSLVEKTYVDGSVAYTVVRGVYKGVSTSEIVVEYGEIEFLNSASRYEDSPGLIYKKGEHEKTWFNLGSDDQYLPPDKKQPVGIWGPSKNIEEGYCSLGDVAVQGYDYPQVQHYIAHAIAPGALVSHTVVNSSKFSVVCRLVLQFHAYPKPGVFILNLGL